MTIHYVLLHFTLHVSSNVKISGFSFTCLYWLWTSEGDIMDPEKSILELITQCVSFGKKTLV